jgi:hypothetical protein
VNGKYGRKEKKCPNLSCMSHDISLVRINSVTFPFLLTVLIIWTTIGTVIITLLSPPSCTDYDSLLSIMTHTSTTTSTHGCQKK